MAMKLNQKTVAALKPGPGRRWVADRELTGFGVIVYPTGKKAFVVRYGTRKARRFTTLGDYGPLAVEEARELARAMLGDVAKGFDPVEDRKRVQDVQSFSEWKAVYVDLIRERKRSWKRDKTYLDTAEKEWGPRPLDAIRADDVLKLFKTMQQKGNTTANRWLAAVRTCFSTAWRMDRIKENPAMKVRLLPENPPRARVLSDDELLAVLDQVAALPDPFTRAAFTLLIETGARRSEVLRARWEDVDLEGGTWRLPRPKTGKPQTIPLNHSTVAMLRNLPNVKSPFLVPGKDPEKPRADLKRAWDKIREGAKLEGVNIHDIRRTFGLHVARSAGLHIASKLLRHSAVTVTERVYAPLGIEDLRKASEKVNQERGKILTMRRAKKEGKA